MTRQLIVAVFGSGDTARQAANDFEALSEKNEGFHIENGVVVEKDAAGKLAVLAAESRPFKGGVIGAIAGGLLGILAGPLGVVTGMDPADPQVDRVERRRAADGGVRRVQGRD